MKYKKFTIESYRAITDPISIDLERTSLFPIIGINECGKTTILHAIFAFDYFNDELNHGGRHLSDSLNLYSPKSDYSCVSAEIIINKKEFSNCLKYITSNLYSKGKSEWKDDNDEINRFLNGRPKFGNKLTIKRDLSTKIYSISYGRFSSKLQNEIARAIVGYLPYILYFDDFQDSVEEKIEIVSPYKASDWLKIVAVLFEKTDCAFSVYNLPNEDERKRKTILAEVGKKLNDALTKEWQHFNLDDSDNLKVSLEYSSGEQNNRHYLQFGIVETNDVGDKYFFNVIDRSKGFFWFFNFVMKLEFNPKVTGGSDIDSIYLLDEPGSYLHATAQIRLCKKLKRLAEDNKVIYCTHSHYLLDPEVVPMSAIKVAEKDGTGKISLVPIHEYKGSLAEAEKRSAFQPLLDALEVKPFGLDFMQGTVVITEGIVDYYLLDIFKENRDVKILPSVGANSIGFYIGVMIGWQLDYRALWDNDKEGINAMRKAEKHFGEAEADRSFYLLPPIKGKSYVKIQDLVSGEDISIIKRKLGLPANSGFDRVMVSWHYSKNRDEVFQLVGEQTKQRFQILWQTMGL